MCWFCDDIKKFINKRVVVYDDTAASDIKKYSYPDRTVTLKITAGGYRGNSHILKGMRELNDLRYCPNCGKKIEDFDNCASKENDKISYEIERLKRDVEDLKKDLDNVLIGDMDLLTENYIENKRKAYKDLKADRRWIKDQLDNCSFYLYDSVEFEVDINLAALKRIDKKISEIESSKIFKYIKED